jgi:hypothetical protein
MTSAYASSHELFKQRALADAYRGQTMVSTRRAAILTIAVMVCAAALAAAPAQAARFPVVGSAISDVRVHQQDLREETQVSSNWAGYAVTGPDASTLPTPTGPATFTSVSGQWIQPKAKCTRGRSTFSAFWVGIGGFSETSQALEQIGTEANCSAKGKARYSMWYELVPAPSVPIKLKVFPGNVVAASVTIEATTVTLQIRDLTRATRATRVFEMSSPDVTSSEWIAEAPSACDSTGRCVQLPLANFGKVSFTHATATANGHSGTITDSAWLPTQIELVPDAGSPFFRFPGDGSTSSAVPSGLSADGASFSISYERTSS